MPYRYVLQHFNRQLLRIAVLLIAWMASPAYGQYEKARSLLESSGAALENTSSFVYDALYRIKYFDSEDTVCYPVHRCEVIKAPSDTVLGYLARISSEGVDRIYDGSEFCMVVHEQKRVLKDRPAETGKNFTRNNIRPEFIPSYLYAGDPYLLLLSKGMNFAVSEEDTDRGTLWKIAYEFPAGEEITAYNGSLWIEQQTMLPVMKESRAVFMDMQQEYKRLDIYYAGTGGDLVQPAIDASGFPAEYQVEYFHPAPARQEIMKEGDVFEVFQATDLEGQPRTIGPEEWKGRLILLDFWYVGCAPCLRALPGIVDIFERYGGQGLEVWGVNPFDHPVRKKEQIASIRKKFGINYPFLFIERENAGQFRVSAYPTIYLISDGVIVYAKTGFEGDHLELEAKIKSLLAE